MRILLFITVICSIFFKIQCSDVCESDDCKAVANEFKQGMNESADPCTNFYEFTCGSLTKQHEISPWSASWDRLDLFKQLVNTRIKNILEEEALADDILPVRQAKRWYQACMDTDKLETLNLAPLESILVQTGGWPMAIDREEWDEDAFSWQTIEELYFHLTGEYVFYNIAPVDDRTIGIKRGTLPIAADVPPDYRDLESKEHREYVGLCSAVAFEIADQNKANISKDMFEEDILGIIGVEKLLLDIPNESNEEKISVTIDELEKMYNEKTQGLDTKINLRNLLKGLFDMISYKPEEPYEIQTDALEYLVELTKILNIVPKRAIINYLHWHFISSMLSTTTENMRTALFSIVEAAFGVKARQPRWLECIKEVKMSRATAYAYSKKYYNSDTEQTGRDLIENVRNEMRDQIQNAAWLDDKSRALALEKLDKMGVVLGVPDWFKNDTYVANSYKGLIIGNNHLDNVLSAKKFEIRQKMRVAFKDEGPNFASDLDALDINAFYVPQTNSIYLPAANFQKPLFTPTIPNYVNYATVGMFIGHEIGHAFDSDGIKQGLNGEPTAINKEVLDKYDDKAECFLKQYNGFSGDTENPESTKKTFGRQTLGENIADNSGFQAIHNTYKKLISKTGPEKKLPGFEKYTDEQMFFISYGALWCEMSTLQYAQYSLKKDEHSPGKLRVIGVTQNSEDFGKTFNCPKGSPMVPDQQCNIWERAH